MHFETKSNNPLTTDALFGLKKTSRPPSNINIESDSVYNLTLRTIY